MLIDIGDGSAINDRRGLFFRLPSVSSPLFPLLNGTHVLPITFHKLYLLLLRILFLWSQVEISILRLLALIVIGLALFDVGSYIIVHSIR
jgi:hypothetical protein